MQWWVNSSIALGQLWSSDADDENFPLSNLSGKSHLGVAVTPANYNAIMGVLDP